MKNKRALIVDDSKTACVVMARLLKQNGVESDSCYSGLEALEYLKTNKPAVIFMDHNMPGMDGFEVVKNLKESPDTATIPVMMYTAKSGEDVFFSQARALGAIDVLPKELEAKHVQQALTQLGLMPQQRRKEDKHKQTVEEKVATTTTSDAPAFVLDERFGDMLQDKFQQIYKTSIRSHISEQIYGSVSEFLDQYKYDQNQFNSKLQQAINQQRKDVQQQIAAVEEDNANQWRQFEQQQSEHFSSLKLMLVALVFIIGAGAWYLWELQQQINQQTQTLQSQLMQSTQKLESAATLLEQKLTEQPQAAVSNQPIGSADQSALTEPEIESSQPGWSLSHWDVDARAFVVFSDKQYHGYFNSVGELSEYRPERYYVDPECFGTAFVPVEPGLVIKDEQSKLWYVELNAMENELLPASKKSAEGSCENIETSVPMALQPLIANEASVTGIAPVKLSFTVVNE